MLFFRRKRDYSPVSIEEIERERMGRTLGWWKVVYDDGREFYHGQIRYSDIDRRRVREFHVLDWTGRTIFKLELDPSRTPIFRRRVKLGIGSEGGVTYVVGYITRDGYAELHYIAPDGSEVRPPYRGPVGGVDVNLRGEESAFLRPWQKRGYAFHS